MKGASSKVLVEYKTTSKELYRWRGKTKHFIEGIDKCKGTIMQFCGKRKQNIASMAHQLSTKHMLKSF